MINRKAGFWIRLLGRLIDLILISAIIVASAFGMLERSDGWHFKENWMFYIWIVEIILLLAAVFLVIPFFWDGKTIGMFITRTKIKFKDNNKMKSIIIRELFFSISWISLTILVCLIINHTLIIKFSLTDKSAIKFTNWEKFRITIITSIGSILSIIQFIFIISIIIRGEKNGLHDAQSKTETVWINRYINKIYKKDNEEKIKIKPKPVNNIDVIWVD
ncbi:MAG: RDD family protein [Mycoplasmatales bacterium]|nr:RDD family protein [Mycoplasmatales bacterium]